MEDKSAGIETLSERQKEILRLLARHYQTKEIARLLNITERTVKAHMDAARRRLGVTSSREAVRIMTSADPADPTVHFGQWPIMPIAETGDQQPGSGHDRAHPIQPTRHDDPLEPTGDSPEHDGDPGQASRRDRHSGRDPDPVQDRGIGQGAVHPGLGGGLDNDGLDAIGQRLNRLSVARRFLAILLIALAMLIVVIAVIAGAATMIQGIRTLTGQTA